LIIPIRCFTCGAVVADKWEPFSNRVMGGEDPEKVLTELGVNRYCCRRMLLSHVNIIREIIHYTRPI